MNPREFEKLIKIRMNKKAQIHVAWNRIKKHVILSLPNHDARKRVRFLQLYCSITNTPLVDKKQMDNFAYNEYNREGSPIFKDKILPVIHTGKRKKLALQERRDSRKKYLDYLNSPQWANFKKELKKVRGNFCEKCKKEFRSLDGHHLTYERLYNELPKDVMLLCRNCHRNIHKNRRRKKVKVKVV